MLYKELIQQIKKNDIAPVYLLCGDEYQISKLMAKQLKEQLVAPTFENLNYIKYDERKHTLFDVVTFCETMPFMSEKRMVFVADDHLLYGAVGDEEADALVSYLKGPNSSTCLVFLTRRQDKKRKITKALYQYGTVVESPRADRQDLENWILKRLKVGGKQTDRETMNALVEGLEYLEKGSRMTLEDVDNELEKIMSFAKERTRITKEDVLLVLARGMEQSIFRMLELLGMGQTRESLDVLNSLFEMGEPVGRILYMIVRQLRMMYRSRLLKAKGYSTDQIAAETELKPFMIRNALKQANYFSEEKLQKAYERCANMDHMFKSSKNDPKILLEMLIFDLGHKK